MAKIVIAGKAECPYFAKTELLADALAKNLPNFSVHKIVIQPQEWETWLTKTCQDHGWSHSRSPIVWRELVDRGGKGLYMGGANEFQEYAQAYYGMMSDAVSKLLVNVAAENLQMKIEIDEELEALWSLNNPMQICFTNAAHPACYNMVHRLAAGHVLGPQTQVSLRFLCQNDLDLEHVSGMQMEAFDMALPLLLNTTSTCDISEAFENCSLIIFLDELTQEENENKESWLNRNRELFVQYAQLLNKAKEDVKVIVAGRGPVNYNAQVLITNTSIAAKNIVGMSRVLENQAKSLLSEKLHVNSAGIVDVAIWGDPTGPHFADVSNARVYGYDGAIWGPDSFSQSVMEMVYDNKWLMLEFPGLVDARLQKIETNLRHRASMSQAAALISLISHWCHGSPQDQFFSLGVYTDGTHYNIPQGLVFSLPVKFTAGDWQVVDLTLEEETKQRITQLVQEVKNHFDGLETTASPVAVKVAAAATEPATNEIPQIEIDAQTETDVSSEKPESSI